MRRLTIAIAAAMLWLSCGGDDPGTQSAPVALADPAGLTAHLAPFREAVNTPQLQSLGAFALPMYLAGIEVHSISPLTMGKTYEWNQAAQHLESTSRAGAPASAVRVVLYQIDTATNLPVVPLVEVGHADLFPHNDHTGGGPDSTSLRYLVTDTRGTFSVVVADFFAHSHFNPACFCAVVEGWVTNGLRRVDFRVPYQTAPFGPAQFTADLDLAMPAARVRHAAFLPNAGDSALRVDMSLAFQGDSILTTAALLEHSSGSRSGYFQVQVNQREFAQYQFEASGTTMTGPGGRTLTTAERAAVDALFDLGMEFALYVEFPTLTVFYCGC